MATLTVTTSTNFTATFNASQFGGGQISETVEVSGDPDFGVTFSQITVADINGTFSASGWTFPGVLVNIFMLGLDGDDTITGNSQTLNAFRGGQGADILIGGDTFRNSFVYAGPLDLEPGETVTGGAGLDSLDVAGVGGNFNFTVATLTDIDRITFIPGLEPTHTTVTVSGAQIAAGIDSIFNSSDGPVTLNVVGNAVDLSALNFAGWSASTDKVEVDGTGGNDNLIASTQADTVTGLGGDDTIRGREGKDELSGSNGNDKLFGDAGNDVLTGGNGRDILTGGADKDLFDFNSIKESKTGANRDKIMDLKRGHGDRIDLRDIDAQKGSGNQKFTWIGTKDFQDKKGQLRYEDKGSKVIVQGDVNGDGKADFEIFVNIGSLSKGDFLL